MYGLVLVWTTQIREQMSGPDLHVHIYTQHVLNLYFSCNSMNNLSSYCGLIDARVRASEKDSPVLIH